MLSLPLAFSRKKQNRSRALVSSGTIAVKSSWRKSHLKIYIESDSDESKSAHSPRNPSLSRADVITVIELNRIETNCPFVARFVGRARFSWAVDIHYLSMYVCAPASPCRGPNLTIGKSCSRSQPFFELSIIHVSSRVVYESRHANWREIKARVFRIKTKINNLGNDVELT